MADNWTKTADGSYLSRVDNKTYQMISDIPDYDKWDMAHEDKEVNLKELMGLSSGVNKLPTLSYSGVQLKTGSTAFCLDTQDLYIFSAITDTWYSQSGE